MNKRKIIAALLASACVTAGAFGIAGCDGCGDDNKGTDTRDTQIVAVYNLYADNARANGDEVLSYDDWLKEIKGETGPKGDNGKSAYEIAVANGFKGTEKEWLDSLKGSNGTATDGKSAYEIAVKNGFEGTEAEWLASLKGSDGTGTNGKSAYEIAVANGFEGTEEEWLESLKGDKGDPGQSGGQGNKGDQGVSVVSVKQETDKWGICSYFVFTMSDDSTIDTSATPIITIDREKQYYVSDAAEKQLLVSYGVSEERIIVRPINGVEVTDRVITLYTDQVGELMNEIYVRETNEDEHSWVTVNLTDVVAMGGKVDLSKVDVNTVGEYPVTGVHRGYPFSFTLKIKQRTIEEIKDSVCKVWLSQFQNEGEQLLLNNVQVEFFYDDGPSKFVWLGDLAEDGLQIDFGSVEHNVGVYTVSGSYKTFDFEIKVVVYDSDIPQESRAVLAVIPDYYESYFIGQDSEEILEQYCRIYFNNGDEDNKSLREMGATLDGIDLTTAGEKTLSFEYEGVNCEVKFEMLAVELRYTLTGTDTGSQFALENKPVTKLELYNDGSVKVFSGSDTPLLTCEYEMSDNIITIMDEATLRIAFFKCDLSDTSAPKFENLTLADAEENELVELGVLTGTVNEKAVTVTLFESEGIGITGFEVDGVTYVLAYMPLDDTETIMIFGAGMFTVDMQNKTITAVPMEP